MGYIPSADTVYSVAYLTEIGRTYLFNKNNIRFDSAGDDLFEVKKFTLSDTDTNYQTVVLLESGEVPDITGKSEGCLKATSNYIQTNLLAFVFDNVPTEIEYDTNLTADVMYIDESLLPSTSEILPLPTSPSGTLTTKL